MITGRFLVVMGGISLAACATTAPLDAPPLDPIAGEAMAISGAKGLAIAVIDDGAVRAVGAFGVRNAAGDPLGEATVMYGASLTKTVFAYTVLQLAAEGRIGLDQPIAEIVPDLTDFADPQEAYADYRPLKDDPRWRRLTPRILLSHRSGFANFGFLEPDGRLKIHFDPGSRYAYSGDGLILLQYAIEKGLKIDVGAEMQRRVFDPLNMTRTSMKWRDDFRPDLADGWRIDGTVEPHDERSRVRAAGSMDTSIADIAKFAAMLVGDRPIRDAMATPQLPITTTSQFPSLQPEAPPDKRIPDLATGLGIIVFEGPQGRGFFKGGHNDSTANMMVCLIETKRCVVILANDVRAERSFPGIVRRLLGETGMPWAWEYGPEPWAR